MSVFSHPKDRTLAKTDYLTFKERKFICTKNHIDYPSTWGYVERKAEQQAVIIIPIIKHTQEIILIRQFRVPFWKYIIEFPAGLVESNELIEEAAQRELLEETGYSGTVKLISPPLAVSPGLTNELITYCFIEIDETQIQQEKQSLDLLESIEIFKVKKNDIIFFLHNRRQLDDIIDCKVYLSFQLIDFLQEQ